MAHTVGVPELPEVHALVEFLAAKTRGRTVSEVSVIAVSVLKTYDPPIQRAQGRRVTAVHRYGKFLDLELDGLHLMVHLARSGWLRWRPELSPAAARPGKGPLALRLRLDDGSGFELTEAATTKRLAVYLVRDPGDVDAVARLGIDPLGPEFTPERFDALLTRAGRAQIKGVLRDQSVLAGIGNAYSDEVLHAALLSPFRLACALSVGDRERLYAAIRDVLREAVDRAVGQAAAELKAAKRSGLRVHGRTGEACSVCGDTIRAVSFADSALQYCPTCQTGGKPLADRRLSRLLR